MLKRISAALFLSASAAVAHTPEIGQVIRFQPQMLHASKPFSMKGSVTSGKARLETLLEWSGPGSYKLTIHDVPAQFYANGEGAGSWVLYRHGARCVLKTDSLTMNCPAAGFWGAMELSGQPLEAVSALVDSGFVRNEDAAYSETDSRNPPKDPKEKNIRVAIGANGNAANGRSVLAVLEIRGPQFHPETPGEEYPLLQYDQTFLSPLLARYSQEGEIVTIRALSDLSIAQRKTRYAAVIASRLEFVVGKNVRLSFVRHEPAFAKGLQLTPPPKAVGDFATLRDQLSVEGQFFLRSLLLSH